MTGRCKPGRALAAGTFWLAAATFVSKGGVLLATVLLARSLPTSAFAACSYFFLTVSMAAAYASLGLGVTTSRIVAEGDRRDPDRLPAALGALLLLSLLGLLSAAALLAALPPAWVTAGLPVPRGLLAAGVAVTALGAVPEGAVLGAERYRAALAVSLACAAVMVLCAWQAARSGTPAPAMAGFVSAAALKAAGHGVVAARAIRWSDVARVALPNPSALRGVLRVAGPLFLVSLMSASGSWLVGRIILSVDDGEPAFALYSIGLHWFSIAMWLPGLLSRVILPRLVQTARGARGEARALVRRAVALSASISAAGALSALVAGPWLLAFYGPQYAPHGMLIAAYMGAALLHASTNTFASAIIADDGQADWLAYTAVHFAVLISTAGAAAAIGLDVWTGAAARASAAAAQVVLAYRSCRRRELI